MALLAVADTVEARTKGAIRVLFVGNSYTYVNDVPAMVERIARERGRAIDVGRLTAPNYAIEDHVATGAYALALRERFDVVVLQQGPSSLPANREHLRHWSTVAATQARDSARSRGAEARTILFAAWPALENAHTWSNAEASWRLAATAADGCLAPVSTAWRLVREAGGPELYDLDGLHANLDGSYLAALVIADALFPKPYAEPRNALEAAATLADAANPVPCDLAKRDEP